MARINVRHRLVNDFGMIIADEQPDIDEINIVNENYYEDRSRKNKSSPTISESEYKNRKTTLDIIEHDPEIDENIVPLSYKYYANNAYR